MSVRTVPGPEPETTLETRIARLDAYERLGLHPRRVSRTGRLVMTASGRITRVSYSRPAIQT